MPAPIAAAAAASAAGGAAAGGTAAAAGGTAAAAGAAGGAAAGGTAAAGASGTASATAARAGSGALKGAGRKAVSGGKNIASKAKGAYNKLPTRVQKGLKNYAQNKIEDKYQEHQEQKAMKGINPVHDEEGEEEYQNDKQDLKKGCLIGFGGLVGCGCLTSIFVPVFLGALVFLMPYAVVSWLSSVVEVDLDKINNSTLSSCPGCSAEDLENIRNKQWEEKLKALEDEYGSKIDIPALVATLTYNEKLSDVMAYEYTDSKDFKSKEWVKKAEGNFEFDFFQIINDFVNATNGDNNNQTTHSSNQISLLSYVAEGMASSGDTYSDENYKKWLVNGKDGWGALKPLYCTGETVPNMVKSILGNVGERFNTTMKALSDDPSKIPYYLLTTVPTVPFAVTVGSTGFYYNDINNKFRICDHGYIEGMISGVSGIQDEEQKKRKKEQIAQEIIDLAEFYRESDEWENQSTSTNTQGSVCYYKVPGIDEEISDLQVRTILSESGNPEGTSKYQDIPGEGLVDFETYILGVVNPEVGGSSAETWKTQAVVARSFALTRGQGMAKPIGQIGIENGQWVLRIRTSTSDQVFCHPDLGCGSMTGSMQGTTSGAATVYAGGYNGQLTRQPIPEDASIRTEVASTKGQVATKSGVVQHTNFASKEQESWEAQAKAGKKYQDIVKDSYGYEVTSDCRGGIGEYDLEAYFEASKNASMPITCVNSGKSMVDCTLKSKGKNFKSLSQFNDHIKQSINSAGYGTRAAVVAASIALIGDYSMDTGVRLKYTWGGGHSNEHLTKDPVKDPFGLDCSGFIGWAIYHAGFKFATGTTGTYIDTLPHGKINQIKGGQPGDFLVNSHHTVMIIGTYDTGYYLAEAANTADGMRISKLEYSNPSGYYLFDMEDYYNNPKNKR